MIRAAGILFLTDDGQALLLRRGPGGDWPGAWAFPGGKEEPEDDGDLEKTAIRETIEEIGFMPEGERVVLARRISINESTLPLNEPINPDPALGEPVDYTTFLQRIPSTFGFTMAVSEHTSYAWIRPEDALIENTTPPEPQPLR